MPDSLTFGDYRGTKYDAFTSIMFPGKSKTETFTVSNATACAGEPDDFRRPASCASRRRRSTSRRSIRRSRPPTSACPTTSSISSNMIPAGTLMMEVVLVQPFVEFDPNGDYNANSSWRVVPTDWTDINGDGKLYEDKNGNGAINCRIDGGNPNWTHRRLRNPGRRVHALRLRLRPWHDQPAAGQAAARARCMTASSSA